MKRTATITFHASHNYGSVLQSYALQQTAYSLGYQNEIINLRTDRQKDLYTVFTKRRGLKYLLKNASHLLYYRPLKTKYERFEEFIKDKLVCTDKEYKTLDELKAESFDYDAYIAGSDQIWNPVPADFDWSYYLPFVNGKRKIAYAPSFGQLASTGDDNTILKIGEYVKDFDFLSVRDTKAAENIKKITQRNSEVVLDPTLLLKREEWEKLLPENRTVKGKYIFFYTLFADTEILKMVKMLSGKLKLPVVVSNFSNQYDVFTSYKKIFYAGPLEFLDLVRNAEFVITSSFHGTVFSLLFNKPFFAIRGDKDARISELLKTVGLEDRSVNIENIEKKAEAAFNIDFSEAEISLKEKRESSIGFLKEALK